MLNKYEERILEKCEPGTTIGSIRYNTSKTPMEVICPNGHTRMIVPNDVISRSGNTKCKICKGITSTGAYTHEKFASMTNIKLISKYTGSLDPIDIEHPECGHVVTVPQASNILRNRLPTCNKCNSSRRNEEDIIKDLLNNNITLVDSFKGMKTNIQVKHNNCGHIVTINPGHFLYDSAGKVCSECAEKFSTKNKFFTALLENSSELLDEYSTTQKPVTIRNNKCNHQYSVIPNNYIQNGSGINCSICKPVNKSFKEIELINYIKSLYNGWIIENDRTLLKPLELDLVIPDLGLAFEYNGIYWHSEKHKDKYYHYNKTNAIAEYDYQLIHINEDEWLYKQEIVKSRISNLFGKSEKIMARKTKIISINYPKEFLDINHIQGAGAPTSINYGLLYNNELVAVMTFSKPRFDKNYDYELVRYCSKLNTIIVGGASKLLNHFIKNNNGSIISYSDRRWSSGSLYKKLGFKYIRTSDPNYKYYNHNNSLSRYQCQKHRLKEMFPKFYNDSLSEPEIMSLAGYYRVFDSGNDVWVYNK